MRMHEQTECSDRHPSSFRLKSVLCFWHASQCTVDLICFHSNSSASISSSIRRYTAAQQSCNATNSSSNTRRSIWTRKQGKLHRLINGIGLPKRSWKYRRLTNDHCVLRYIQGFMQILLVLKAFK